MKFREDRRKIGATWEEQVLEGTACKERRNTGEGCSVRGSDEVVDAKRCK